MFPLTGDPVKNASKPYELQQDLPLKLSRSLLSYEDCGLISGLFSSITESLNNQVFYNKEIPTRVQNHLIRQYIQLIANLYQIDKDFITKICTIITSEEKVRADKITALPLSKQQTKLPNGDTALAQVMDCLYTIFNRYFRNKG